MRRLGPTSEGNFAWVVKRRIGLGEEVSEADKELAMKVNIWLSLLYGFPS